MHSRACVVHVVAGSAFDLRTESTSWVRPSRRSTPEEVELKCFRDACSHLSSCLDAGSKDIILDLDTGTGGGGKAPPYRAYSTSTTYPPSPQPRPPQRGEVGAEVRNTHAPRSPAPGKLASVRGWHERVDEAVRVRVLDVAEVGVQRARGGQRPRACLQNGRSRLRSTCAARGSRGSSST